MTSKKEATLLRYKPEAACATCSDARCEPGKDLCIDCLEQSVQDDVVFRKGKGWVCRLCEGRGWRWSLPADFSPFYRGTHEISRAMRRTKCSCKGATEKPAESAMERALRAIAEAGRAA